jgi:glycerol kinase
MLQDYFRPVTGLPISTYFSAFKFLWLYEHVAAVRRAVKGGTCLFGTVDTWLIWCLTGGPQGGTHVTDGKCLALFLLLLLLLLPS